MAAGELTQADVLQVVERLFALLSDCMWEAPVAQAKHSVQVKEKVQELKLQVCRRPLARSNHASALSLVFKRLTASFLQGEAEEEDENLPVQEVSFDPEKAQCCVVENGQGLTHGSGGKGYGLASTGISSGCYQWKVSVAVRSDAAVVASCLLVSCLLNLHGGICRT